MGDWTDAVFAAVKRQASRNENGVFTRQDLIKYELPRIIKESKSVGATPEQTLSRELQELADSGRISFEDNRGTYRALDVDTQGVDEGSFVARYHIDGFRSLKSFSISLDSGLNALVGPNGAGKTNFIDFLDFLSILVTRDASSAVSISGGVARVFSHENNKKISPKVTAKVCGTADISTAIHSISNRTLFRFEYSVEVRFSKTHSAIYISSEKVKFFALHNADELRMAGRQIGAIQLRRRSPASDIEPIITVGKKLLTKAIRNPLRYFRRTTAASRNAIVSWRIAHLVAA